LVNVLINLCIGLALIANFGLLGAAICAVLASFINMAQHYYLFNKRVAALHLLPEIAVLVPATLAATATLSFFSWSTWIVLPCALALYAALAFGVSQLSAPAMRTTARNPLL
jgi:peptidoglycan biosynthesis protein MviN/MurJ (putative lipid II flippase)